MDVTVTNHFEEYDTDYSVKKIADEDRFCFTLHFENGGYKEFTKSVFSYTIK